MIRKTYPYGCEVEFHDDNQKEELCSQQGNSKLFLRKGKNGRIMCAKRKMFDLRRGPIIHFLLICLLHLSLYPLESSLLVSAYDSTTSTLPSEALYSKSTPLTIDEIAQLRVRDIKRRLSRQHGYSSVEISKMLDKKEMIEALAFEEHKAQAVLDQNKKREFTKNSVIVALVAVAIVMFWPLISHLWEVAHVNFVVYTGKLKKQINAHGLFSSYLEFFII